MKNVATPGSWLNSYLVRGYYIQTPMARKFKIFDVVVSCHECPPPTMMAPFCFLFSKFCVVSQNNTFNLVGDHAGC